LTIAGIFALTFGQNSLVFLLIFNDLSFLIDLGNISEDEIKTSASICMITLTAATKGSCQCFCQKIKIEKNILLIFCTFMQKKTCLKLVYSYSPFLLTL
jgi:hypothetical protein